MSSTCSMPMLSGSSRAHAALRCSCADICRCVVEAGWQASDLAVPPSSAVTAVTAYVTSHSLELTVSPEEGGMTIEDRQRTPS